MASITDLPHDQRAVLELVLRRGRSYDEIAQLLSIDRAGVRQRAMNALDALGPDAAVPAERRALITDYLLGALPPRVTEQVRNRLAQSAGERAWARVVASELEPIASHPLPEIPGPGGSALQDPAAAADLEPEPREPAAETEAEEEAPPKRQKRQSVLAARRERRRAGKDAQSHHTGQGSDHHHPSTETGRRGVSKEKDLGPGTRLEPGRERPPNRRGGMIVLAAAAIIVLAIVLSLILSGGSSNNKPTAQSTTPPGTTTPAGGTTGATGASGASGATGSSGTKILAQVNLNPPSGGDAKGAADVIRQRGKLGIAIVAQHMKPNSTHDAYAVWLYNSPTDSHLLGFVDPGVKSNGRLQTAGALPANAAHYKKLIVTLETQAKPTAPGTIILAGPFTTS